MFVRLFALGDWLFVKSVGIESRAECLLFFKQQISWTIDNHIVEIEVEQVNNANNDSNNQVDNSKNGTLFRLDSEGGWTNKCNNSGNHRADNDEESQGQIDNLNISYWLIVTNYRQRFF